MKTFGKSVLITTSLFSPEIAANSSRMTTLAEKLAEDGADVTVLTAFPYYSCKPDAKYKGKYVVKYRHGEINVVRTYTFVPKKNTIYGRLLTFLSYMFSSTVYSVFTRKRFDAIVSISPPFFTLITALVLSRIRRIPFVIDIQDLYPDTAIELDKLKNSFLIRIWRALEITVYKKASAIVVISNGFKSQIIKRGIEPDKIFVINSWVDTDKFDPEKSPNRKQSLGLENNFVVLFLGSIGYPQGVEKILKTAGLVAEYEKIRFLFVGGGTEKHSIMKKTQDMKIRNVSFLPPQPFCDIPSFINAADVCLVSLVKRKLYEITIPSKTYEYMAMGKPVVMAANGQAAALIDKNRCGITVEPENPESLKQAILDIYSDARRAAKLGRNSRLAASKYSAEQLVPKYGRLIHQITGNGGL